MNWLCCTRNCEHTLVMIHIISHAMRTCGVEKSLLRKYCLDLFRFSTTSCDEKTKSCITVVNYIIILTLFPQDLLDEVRTSRDDDVFLRWISETRVTFGWKQTKSCSWRWQERNWMCLGAMPLMTSRKCQILVDISVTVPPRDARTKLCTTTRHANKNIR